MKAKPKRAIFWFTNGRHIRYKWCRTVIWCGEQNVLKNCWIMLGVCRVIPK